MRNGLSMIKKYEGCKLHAYADVVGVWTIGYGHTKGVKPGQTITQEQADTWLMEEYDQFEAGVKKLLHVPVNENQLGALVCFAYNVGLGNLSSSTLLKKINAGDFKGADSEFAKWNKAGGKPYAGLTARRLDEAMLFLK
jgi:lysozyme